MPTTVRDPFALLGVTPQSSDQEIHAAWRLLMKHAHPDAGGSHEYAAALNWAHDTLLDPQARFDFVMRQRQAPPRQPRPEPPRSAQPSPPEPPPPPPDTPPVQPRATKGSRLLWRIGIAVVIIGLITAAVPFLDIAFQASPPMPATVQTGILRVTPVKAGEAVPGFGYGVNTCDATKHSKGRTSPDPYCSPGVLLANADRESVCGGDLSQRRPEQMARWAAKQAVLRAYGAQRQQAPAVSLVIPQSLGGAWHIDNLWAGRTTATSQVVDKVIALMCKPGAPITYPQVIQAAQANSLHFLLQQHSKTRSRNR